MDCYLGEIRLFGGNYAPEGFHLCDGAAMSISEYEELYALIGTTYGGDGTKTFNLPDLRGRVPIHRGNGYELASSFGAETVAITTATMPSHSHVFSASKAQANAESPAGATLASLPAGYAQYFPDDSATSDRLMSPAMIGEAGEGKAHSNVMPSLVVSCIICMRGTYPVQEG